MIISSGILTYDPKSPKHKEDNWLILSCDNSISKHCQELLFKEKHIVINTQLIWGTHVSIIRGEHPNNGFWGYSKNEVINFEYNEKINHSDTYYWLDVVCSRLCEIRQYYGLTPQPFHKFHLTIGNRS